MQTFTPRTPFHKASCELIDDNDLFISDDVVDVLLKHVVSFQRLFEEMRPLHVLPDIKTGNPNELLGSLDPRLGQHDAALLLLHLEVLTTRQTFRDSIRDVVVVSRFRRWAGNNQWSSRLVDQNAVDLVDNRKCSISLHLLAHVELHVVA